MAERWRQALHLEPPQGWLNDPNGLCFYGGKYHVFFQYAPDSAQGAGEKAWGHFVSQDLRHWSFRGIPVRPALPEDRSGVYSGCAVTDETGALRIFYTGNVKEKGDFDYITAGRGANVITAAAPDGEHFGPREVLLRNRDYPADCTCHVRDPKVWQEPDGWRMILGARTRRDSGEVLVYRSDNLTRWTLSARVTTPEPFGYMWECPDYFELGGERILSVCPQGLPSEAERWQNIYQSGWFRLDGPLEQGTLRDFTEWDMGFDFYAPQSMELPDGRRLLFGWMGLPDAPYTIPTTALGWQHCLTLPRELFRDHEGRICQRPARELAMLRGKPHTLQEGESLRGAFPMEIDARTTGDFALTLCGGLHLRYDAANGLATMEFTDAALGGGRTRRVARLPRCRCVRAVIDRSSAEFYLDGGAVVMSTRMFPHQIENDIILQGAEMTLWPLMAPDLEL